MGKFQEVYKTTITNLLQKLKFYTNSFTKVQSYSFQYQSCAENFVNPSSKINLILEFHYRQFKMFVDFLYELPL